MEDMLRPTLVNNRLNRATASSNEWGLVVPTIKPKYTKGGGISTSIMGHGVCLAEVLFNAIDELACIIGDVKDADVIMIHKCL